MHARSRRTRPTIPSLMLAFLALASCPAGAAERRYEIRPEASRVRVHLFKKGLLKGFGHGHELDWSRFSGSVRADWLQLGSASVELSVEAASLSEQNLDIGEGDRREIEETARSARVLDAALHPQIRFRSTSVHVRHQDAAGALLDVSGTLEVRGVPRDLTVPVTVTLDGEGLRARGSVELRQSGFGIKPVSAALGTIKVKDEMRIDFELQAGMASSD
jgi:polyisoprenoid-binding protein YceI